MNNPKAFPPPVLKQEEEKKGIEVVAIRPGHFDRRRIEEGEIFTVDSFTKLGEWMKCLDVKMEEKHQANIAAKKRERKAGK